MRRYLPILIHLLATTLFPQINLSPMWQEGDYWKPRTYDNHADSYGNYHAVDFYYGARNRPDIYKNGIAGRPILAPIAGTLFIHLIDATSCGNGNFPPFNAVQVFQGLDAIPKTCFSIVDSLGVTVRIDMSMEIDFNSNNNRINFSHLQINDIYFNSVVEQKIRNAVRKFYNRSAVGTPRRVAITTSQSVSGGTTIGTIDDWGIANQPHLHFQLFSGTPYSEMNPYLGTPQNLSNASIITIGGQKIYETSYEGIFNSDYHYPAMLRRNFNLDEAIVVNAAWDGANGARLRLTPGGDTIKTLGNGSQGIIKQTTPQHEKLGNNNYLWYNVQFGSNTGWIAAEYIDENSATTGISIQVDPEQIIFPNTTVNTSAGTILTIINASNSTENLSGSVGSISSPFSIVDGGGDFIIPPGGNRTVTVGFYPTSADLFQSTLNITHNATNLASPIVVNISGRGVDPTTKIIVTMGPLPIVFDTLYIDETDYWYLKINVTQSSNANFIANFLGLNQPYSITPNVLTIAPGTADSVKITFTPIVQDYFEQILTIIHNATNQVNPYKPVIRGWAKSPSGINEFSNTNNFYLLQNYPNPFNPVTNISFAIPSYDFVTVKVYDVLGNVISTLVNEAKEPGNYTLKFDGSKLTSGVYYYVMRVGDYVQTKKMVLIK